MLVLVLVVQVARAMLWRSLMTPLVS